MEKVNLYAVNNGQVERLIGSLTKQGNRLKIEGDETFLIEVDNIPSVGIVDARKLTGEAVDAFMKAVAHKTPTVQRVTTVVGDIPDPPSEKELSLLRKFSDEAKDVPNVPNRLTQ
jgi:hypothetical protein